MSDGRWETQGAIYTALTGANVADGRIFAPVLEGYNPPNEGDAYVSIEDGDAISDDCIGVTGLNERIELHVWQRASSYKDVREAISWIRDTLHDKSLTITGSTYAHSLVRSDQVMRDPDGLTLHAVVEVIVQHYSSST
jgi:hypothetical protein